MRATSEAAAASVGWIITSMRANSKLEIRNSKQIRNSNCERRNPNDGLPGFAWPFLKILAFEFRISRRILFRAFSQSKDGFFGGNLFFQQRDLIGATG